MQIFLHHTRDVSCIADMLASCAHSEADSGSQDMTNGDYLSSDRPDWTHSRLVLASTAGEAETFSFPPYQTAGPQCYKLVPPSQPCYTDENGLY
jgi:hypothetical protein